jgi:putative ABC transport system ATP-binding protein
VTSGVGSRGPRFELDDVSVLRGAVRLLDGVHADLPAGRCTALVGPSGAGKSTLLRLLNRLEDASSGRVLLDGVEVGELDVLALRRRVGLVGQRPVLLADQVAAELRVGRPDLPRQRVPGLLAQVGLPAAFAARATAELSGGEAQRVCLARALALDPAALLLDEPTSALDESNAALVGELVRGQVAAGGTVVLVSHDLSLVRAVADQVLVLAAGRVVSHGAPDDVEYLTGQAPGVHR